MFIRVNWVKQDGIRYQKEACVILGRNEDELLIFGRIVDVYIIKSRVLLEISVLETIDFNEHFHAFVVCERKSRYVCLAIRFM